MKKIALSIGIAACTLIAANLPVRQAGAQEVKIEKQPVLKATPVTKANTSTKLSTATPHQHPHQQSQQQLQPVPQNPNAPDIVFETDVMDYGKVE